jgi:hypothetical protein
MLGGEVRTKHRAGFVDIVIANIGGGDIRKAYVDLGFDLHSFSSQPLWLHRPS